MPTRMVVTLAGSEGEPDWVKMRGADVYGAIQRAPDGPGNGLAFYRVNRERAIKAGLLWGAWWNVTAADPEEQAKRFVQDAGEDSLTLLAAGLHDPGVPLDLFKSFLDWTERLARQQPAVYLGGEPLARLIDARDDRLGAHRLWLQDHRLGPPDWPRAIWRRPWLWEYQAAASCPGVRGTCPASSFDYDGSRLASEWVMMPKAAARPDKGTVLVALDGLPPGYGISIAIGGTVIAAVGALR